MASPKKSSKSPCPPVLAVGSHPDDIEFGCAGTLRRFYDRGHNVYQLLLTCGEEGGMPENRRKEQKKAAQLLGVKEIFWGSFSDTRLPFYDNVISIIEQAVKKINPGFVFVHYGNDTHQDHRHVSTCTVAATRKIPNVLFYEGPTTYDFQPNVFVDIGKCLKQKFGALTCHHSQVMRTNIKSQSILDIAKATAVFRGTQCKVQHAEAFIAPDFSAQLIKKA